jgi:hypothetical protein
MCCITLKITVVLRSSRQPVQLLSHRLKFTPQPIFLDEQEDKKTYQFLAQREQAVIPG